MAFYEVVITEVLEKTVDVEADSLEMAEAIAEENWKNAGKDGKYEEYILTSDDFVNVDFHGSLIETKE